MFLLLTTSAHSTARITPSQNPAKFVALLMGLTPTRRRLRT